jgi:uncharacterized membrane protein YfcA
MNSFTVVSTHFLSGHVTPEVLRFFWWGLPAVAIGFLAGQSLDKWLNPELFRKIVLVVLVGLGIRLMLG